MYRIEKALQALSSKANWISMAAVFAMMAITVLDVVLRYLRLSIPGAYDIVGLLGAVVISFSLAYTSAEKGHIAVEFLAQKLPERPRAVMDAITGLASTVFFGLLTWRCSLYAVDFLKSGEVSMTIKMPVYPFVLGTALGCGLLTVLLAVGYIKTMREAFKK